MVTMSAIEAHGLVKVFSSRSGEVRALDGVDLTVPEGTVMGLLGPNGAGKTTAVRVLTTLLTPDAGSATVAGCDVVTQPDKVRRRIGLSGQYAAVDEYLTGRENLAMVGRLYHLGKAAAAERADELLQRFELSQAGDRPVKGYSGGMRRRLDLAGALVARPRLGLWDVIEDLVREGTTLLLTTQYLEEADRLADTIAVVDRGRVIARGTSDELKAQVGGERLELSVASHEQVPVAAQALVGLGTGEPHTDPDTRTITMTVDGGAATLVEAVRRLDGQVHLVDVALHRPTLDDVFLTLTGHAAETRIGAPQGPGRSGRSAA
jgi:ABC-2 type transport system ATP-binding protein